MTTADIFNRHVQEYEKWYTDHPEVFESELLALKEAFNELPEDIRGIEVGLGTGKFSEALGIREGVEPSEEMARLARDRGVEIIKGRAERLPHAAMQFHFVLFVTICHLESLEKALEEAYRVLKPGGRVIIGFLDSERPIARSYVERRPATTFYKHAVFQSVRDMERELEKARFRDFKFWQTLYGELEDIDEIQYPKQGHGEGSFVVVAATKR